MNIQYRKIDSLELNINSFVDRMLFYQEHYYDNVYFVNPQGIFIGYLNYIVEYQGQTTYEKEAVNKSISIASIYEWFHVHPGKFRVPVIDDNGYLKGEFYDTESNGECLYKRIEDRALEILTCIKSDVLNWSKGLRISVLNNTSKTEVIKSLLPEVAIATSVNNNSDFTIDLLHTPHIRKLLNIDGEKILSPSQILIPLLIKKVYNFCCNNKIYFYVFNGINKTEIKGKNIKEVENESLPLEKVLQDVDYLKKFCGNDIESFKMLMKHSTDLNQISKTINNGIYNELVDFSDEEINFIDGKRITIGGFENSTQSIHIFGPCVAQGLCVVDSKTIPSIIQGMLDEFGCCRTRVFNHGISYGKDLVNDLLYMMATPLAPQDIIIWINGFSPQEITFMKGVKIPIIDGKSFAVGLHNWYLNNPFHCNFIANREMAKVIFQQISEIVCSQPFSPSPKSSLIESEHIPLSYDNESLLKSKELDNYVIELKKLRKPNSKIINGCVVVNANPCTNGHVHLIKQARKEVDHLYVFLVEQDTGPFNYLDRELMLKESLKELDGVEIISGGSIFTSSKGFPGYFNRSRTHTSPLLNHKIFVKKIAPALKISKRFFGEEPSDNITHLLNVTALEYLPKHGIDVKIIKRLAVDGMPVSAKNVRRLYNNRQYKQMEKLVPKFVYHYLQQISK